MLLLSLRCAGLGACVLVAACGVDREEILDGKDCGLVGECAPGFVCDAALQRCFRGRLSIDEEGEPNSMSVGGNSGQGGGAAVELPEAPGSGGSRLDSGVSSEPDGSAVLSFEGGPLPLVAYDFNGPSGSVVPDVSGLSPRIDLQLSHSNRVRWDDGQLEINSPVTLLGKGDHRELNRALKASNALSVEIWFTLEDLNRIPCVKRRSSPRS